MPWKKRIQPGEKVPLKLTAAQRTLVLEGLTCLDPNHETAIRETPVGKPVMMMLDHLDDFGGYLAAEANHTEDRKLRQKLDTTRPTEFSSTPGSEHILVTFEREKGK